MKRHFFKFLLTTVKALVLLKRLIFWFARMSAKFFAWALRPAIPFVVAPIYQIFRRYWKQYLEISSDPWERRRVVLTSTPAVAVLMSLMIFSITHASVNASTQPGVISGSKSLLLTHILSSEGFDWTAGVGEVDESAEVLDQIPTLVYKNGGAVAYVFPYSGAVGRAETVTEDDAPAVPKNPIQKYAVQKGDSLAKIARQFGIKVETLLWANNLTANSVLRPGDSLTVPTSDGIIYTVKSGGTLSDVSKIYNVPVKTIAAANGLSSAAKLQKGQSLVIPGARPPTTAKPTTPSTPTPTTPTPTAPTTPTEVITRPPLAAGEKMLWPTKRRVVTQYFKASHPGLDIDGDYTDPIYASDSGTVTFSGWNNGGYGNMILINHGNGIVTRYAHGSKVFVRVGQQVNKGDIIAMVGTTGRSTGTHLHFELIVNGRQVNPFSYVR